jgi:hypothetical protein
MKLIIQTSKVNVHTKDDTGRTLLSWHRRMNSSNLKQRASGEALQLLNYVISCLGGTRVQCSR